MAAAIARRSAGMILRRLVPSAASRSLSASSGPRFPPSDEPRSAAFRRADLQFVSDVLERTSGEQKHDIVHMLIMRNNSFVTVTDAKGNKKFGASAGSLDHGKSSRYACDATSEHVARMAVNIGPAVIKVKGSAFFKKKKEAILGWKEGSSYGDHSRIVQLQDVTRLAHNGCRRRKQRRI